MLKPIGRVGIVASWRIKLYRRKRRTQLQKCNGQRQSYLYSRTNLTNYRYSYIHVLLNRYDTLFAHRLCFHGSIHMILYQKLAAIRGYHLHHTYRIVTHEIHKMTLHK